MNDHHSERRTEFGLHLYLPELNGNIPPCEQNRLLDQNLRLQALNISLLYRFEYNGSSARIMHKLSAVSAKSSVLTAFRYDTLCIIRVRVGT